MRFGNFSALKNQKATLMGVKLGCKRLEYSILQEICYATYFLFWLG